MAVPGALLCDLRNGEFNASQRRRCQVLSMRPSIDIVPSRATGICQMLEWQSARCGSSRSGRRGHCRHWPLLPRRRNFPKGPVSGRFQIAHKIDACDLRTRPTMRSAGTWPAMVEHSIGHQCRHEVLSQASGTCQMKSHVKPSASRNPRVESVCSL